LPGGSRATPAGALERTHRQNKNPPNDSTRIAWGLGGSYRVHKPKVPHGPASQQRLGLAEDVANDTQLLGWPKYLNDRPEGRSNLRPEGLSKEERRPLPTMARLSDRKDSFPTPTHLSDRKAWPNNASDSNPRLRPGYTEPLLTALLRLARSEPTGTDRPVTLAR